MISRWGMPVFSDLRHHTSPCENVGIEFGPSLLLMVLDCIEQRVEMQIDTAVIVLDESIKPLRQIDTTLLWKVRDLHEWRIIVSQAALILMGLVVVVKGELGNFARSFYGR